MIYLGLLCWMLYQLMSFAIYGAIITMLVEATFIKWACVAISFIGMLTNITIAVSTLYEIGKIRKSQE